jgi:hypothetical protein
VYFYRERKFQHALGELGGQRIHDQNGRQDKGCALRDVEPPGWPGFAPLVPPPRTDGPAALLEMQQRGIEMVMAANRLALTWLQQAANHHAQVTRRTLDEMAETARRMTTAEAPPEAAKAAIDMVDRAQALGLETAQDITVLMQRMQGDTVALMGQVLRGGKSD